MTLGAGEGAGGSRRGKRRERRYKERMGGKMESFLEIDGPRGDAFTGSSALICDAAISSLVQSILHAF